MFLKIYFYFFLLLFVAGRLLFGFAFRPLWWNYVEFAVGCIALLGMFLYVYKKRTFLRSAFWKVFFIVDVCWVIVSNGIVRPSLTDSPGSLGVMLAGVVLCLPIYYALFRYAFHYLPRQNGDSNNSMQATPNGAPDG
jgi:hypothetical protein